MPPRRKVQFLLTPIHRCTGRTQQTRPATELAIAPARQHFTILDASAQAINVPVKLLLDALELERLERLKDGG